MHPILKTSSYIWGSHLLLPFSLHLSKIIGGTHPPAPSLATALTLIHVSLGARSSGVGGRRSHFNNNNNNNNTDFKCLFLGKFKDTGKKFTMKIN